jgi:hypothetical protein
MILLQALRRREHLGPVGPKRLNPEIRDGEPQELLDRDSTSRAVRHGDLIPLAAGAWTMR